MTQNASNMWPCGSFQSKCSKLNQTTTPNWGNSKIYLQLAGFYFYTFPQSPTSEHMSYPFKQSKSHTHADIFIHLQISQSSTPWGSVPPCVSHADICRLEGGDNAAARSGPPDTRGGRPSRGATRLPPPRSTPGVDRCLCRTVPACSPAPPADSPKMQILAGYLVEREALSGVSRKDR